MIKKTFTLQLALILLLLVTIPSIKAQINHQFNAEFSYLKGKDASSLNPAWYKNSFDHSAWLKAPAPFRYGDGTGGTVLSDMSGSYSTLYLKSEFTASRVEEIKNIEFRVDFDDGFVIWVNGIEVLRQNVSQNLSYDAYALGNHESGSPTLFIIDSSNITLNNGINSIAIQAFNVTLSSSDFYFDMSISAVPQLPELDNTSAFVEYSHKAGFYGAPFQLTLTSTDPQTNILYTLDGSDPSKSATAIKKGASTTLLIDPENATGRGLTPAVILRTSVQKEGYAPAKSRTRTFLFTNKVRSQAYPGAPWPSSNVNGQRIDLKMDPNVVNDSRYTNLIEQALLDIPSLSLVSDNENFFDRSYGIYVNPEVHYGKEWERDCSIELLDPQGTSYFQANAGMRIRGGASRGKGNPKHAFRLFFREEYGDAKLRFPLFGDEGTDTFDKIDLRTEQNYSWSKDGPPAGDYNTFIRDIFSRKLQDEMGRPYSRSRYYHLYLNGLYWGLFMTEERPESRYAESYFGGDNEDYDVVKVTTQSWPYYNIATDGNMDAWNEIWQMCGQGFSSNASYFKLEGKDATGQPLKNAKVLVDIDNLIDYMAMIFYTGSFDGPVSAWHGENMPNNYYAIYNRENKGRGFVFVGHDQEQSMMVDGLYVGEGIDENRVTIPNMWAAGLEQFQPQWLHFKLTDNAEYRLRFADRMQSLFYKNGPLTPDSAMKLFEFYEDQLQLPIIAESARWGDANANPARTKDDDWIPAINQIKNDFFPVRTNIVINQLKEADLLTSLKAPDYYSNNQIVNEGLLSFSGQKSIKLANANNAGEIIYTLNGDDPRMIGGQASTSSLSTKDELSLNIQGSTIISARVKSGNKWSALSKLMLTKTGEDYAHLKITELHYHPEDIIQGLDTIYGTDLEFLELKNTGQNAIDISGITIDSGIYHIVPEKTILAPQKFYVVASKPKYFYEKYGMNPSGNYKKNLSNAGEYILVTDPVGNEIFSLFYMDDFPWPKEADGDGYSLVSRSINPTGNPNDYAYWRKSHSIGGSPFADDLASTSIADYTIETGNYKIYPNPATEYFTVLNPDQAKTSMSVYDNYGKMVYNRDFSDTEITVNRDQLPSSGMYIVQLKAENRITTIKLIIW